MDYVHLLTNFHMILVCLFRDYVHLLTNFPVRAMAGVLTDLDEDYVGPDAKSKEVRYLDTVINIPKIIFDHLMDTLQTV